MPKNIYLPQSRSSAKDVPQYTVRSPTWNIEERCFKLQKVIEDNRWEEFGIYIQENDLLCNKGNILWEKKYNFFGS